jgi:hypothetical protein
VKKRVGLLGTAVTGAALLLWFASHAAEAPTAAPPGQAGIKPPLAAAQPATVALLSAGLVVLGIYAKRKNHKRS